MTEKDLKNGLETAKRDTKDKIENKEEKRDGKFRMLTRKVMKVGNIRE